MNPLAKLTPYFNRIRERILWRSVITFAFILAIISIPIAMFLHDGTYLLHTLIIFMVLVMYLVVDTFIEEYKFRNRKSLSELTKAKRHNN